VALALAALPACSARTRSGGASCAPACGSASCGFDGCGTACGAHQGGCGNGQVCAGSGGAPAACVTEVRPQCGAPPSGTAGDLVARIVVDEPAAYTAAGGNQCAPADGACYFPDLGVSLTRGHAPLAVFFQGWPSSPRDAIVAWLWDFGAGTDADPHGRCFSGFNAAHVFETPGDYTVTLRVLDAAGHVASATTTVTVLAPSGTTYYVDAVIGDDACDGRSSTVDGPGRCPWKTADRAFGNMARPAQFAPVPQWRYQPGDQILFRRGQRFDLTATVSLGYGFATQGFTFGAFGTGAKPVIQWRGGAGTYAIDTGYGFGLVTFEDLQFSFLDPRQGGAQAEGLLAPICGAKNVLALRCDFLEPKNGAFATNGSGCGDLPVDSSFFLVDSTVANPLTHATSTTQVYFFGVHGLALMNNTFDLSGNHTAYTGPVDKGLVWHNVNARPAFGRTAWRSMGGTSAVPDNNLWFAENRFLGWIDPVAQDVGAHNGGGNRYNYHLINLAPGGNAGELLAEDVMFERNVITNFSSGMNIVNGRNITVRNNVFVSPAPDATFLTLSDAPTSPGLTRPLSNVRIVGNTFVVNGAGDPATFIRIHPWTTGATAWGGNHAGIVVQNNVFHAVAGRDAVAVDLVGTGSGLLSALDVDHNVVHVPAAADGAPFAIGGTRHTLASWRTTSGQDVHSVTADPRFVGPLATPAYGPGEPSYAQELADVAAYLDALHLTTQSPLGGGAVLPIDAYFDFDVAPRLGDGAVDAGAFEAR
jgi:PKD repeat protein